MVLNTADYPCRAGRGLGRPGALRRVTPLRIVGTSAPPRVVPVRCKGMKRVMALLTLRVQEALVFLINAAPDHARSTNKCIMTKTKLHSVFGNQMTLRYLNAPVANMVL